MEKRSGNVIYKIVSGAQSGVDQAALTAGVLLGIATGGWAAQGWMTEDGPRPDLAEFGLKECSRPGYPARTEMNVRDSDATLIISHEKKLTGGSYDTWCVAEAMDKPVYHAWVTRDGEYVCVLPSGSKIPISVWLGLTDIKVLNVAGPRKSKCSWIEEVACQLVMRELEGRVK